MAGWSELPTELWYMIVGKVHCVLDRAQLSVTCSVLHGVVCSAPPPAPLQAFRCYHDKLAGVQECLNSPVLTRAKLMHPYPQSILPWHSLLSMKDIVTKDLKAEQKQMCQLPFIRLVMKWIEVTKPKRCTFESVLKALAKDSFYRPLVIELLLKWIDLTEPEPSVISSIFMMEINCQDTGQTCPYRQTEEVHRHLEYNRKLRYLEQNKIHWRTARGGELPQPYAAYNHNEIEYSCFDIDGIRWFNRVNMVGYVVLGLPFTRYEYFKCTEAEVEYRHPYPYYTLSIESGYYVVRQSTIEECHEQCIRDCTDLKKCPMNRGIYLKKPVKFMYFMSLQVKDYVSLFLTPKEEVDEIVDGFNFRSGYLKIRIFVISPFIKITL